VKPLRKRVLQQLQRGQEWLERSRQEYEQDNPQDAEKNLELALAELRLALEKSKFWGWQEKKEKTPPARRRLFPGVAVGLVVFFVILAGVLSFGLHDSSVSEKVVGELEVNRQLTLPSRDTSPRILDEDDYFIPPESQREGDFRGWITPADF